MFPDPLRVFYEAGRHGSIRKASDNLGLAPSSVSRQVAILERQVGTKLFERSENGVTLTHAGQLVANFARTVLLDYDSLRSDLDDLKGRRRSLIRIAAVESVVAVNPIAAIAAFRSRFDGVSFRLRMMAASEVVNAVKAGEVDIGATFCPKPDFELMTIMRIPEPVIAATPIHHPLASRESISLPELAQFSIALPEANFGVRQFFDQACHACGLSLTPTLSSNSFEALREFARCGAGISILPKGALLLSQSEYVKAISLESEYLSETYVEFLALRNRRHSNVLKQFIADLKKTIE